MISEPFDPADAGTWIARGRRPEHAAVIAEAWRHFPDLPAAAAPEDRLARMRQRALALRPVMESMSRAAEEERQARNFAFTEARIAKGEGDDRDRAILSARSLHGYDWDRAVQYAYGWYAAIAGWEPRVRRPGCSTAATIAYDQGFAEGGGNRDDLFDTARRAFEAAAPQIEPPLLATGRPRPSEWPKPTDEPLPARWSRRLLLLGAPEAGLVPPSGDAKPDVAVLLPTLQACQGYGELFVIIISGAGFHAFGNQPPDARPLEAASGVVSGSDPRLDRQLRALLAGRDFDDVLIAAQEGYLALLDAHASALPLCRTMERTRNTVLQQRAHFRIWLDRGLSAGESVGAGHIRWGKAAKGLTGKLGEFTARYAGKSPAGGHRIVVETEDGEPAHRYVTPQGEPLSPETVIGNRSHLRKEMAARLRAFGGATRLSAAPISDLLDALAA
ncbi:MULTISPECIES: hypothetical protein [Sphingomonadaceae]|jgi:hypothetical protein|uniref:Uncharacterized protein n=6 Tax=root TaxID=1 RepID=A0A249MZN8_SPHXE|nr:MULTISPECIES: hypothetical protein [Sphingomonadaceae]TNE44998.1 MAG: hypothetical protein EP345_02105 [Sphingomonadales bacterium]HWH18450.1 hypothetical protein [Allosphingosinicella sp.]ASY46820.1 hypothetical protein CJD35_20235 [Sphingobium xenophagum]QGP81582.1 hypothetical protein GL174_21000 [Sphingobium sp. CAP-1]RYM08060.1 hypothetical protein EWH12_17565 [Sphingobium cupriresistens]|tara:strand:+ start:13295 stop:14629 length:1335 start_codon:yes stop_codon:yes gene_type:complete